MQTLALLLLGFAAIVGLRAGIGAAQTAPSLSVSIVGTSTPSANGTPLPLTSFDAARSVVEAPGTTAISIVWPDATELDPRSLGQSKVTVDAANETLVFESTSTVPFSADSFMTMLVVDWDAGKPNPTIALGLSGDFGIVAGGKTVNIDGELSASTDKLEIVTEQGRLVVPEAVQTFFGSGGDELDADALLDGVGFSGTMTLQDAVGDFSTSSSARINVAGSIETSVADLVNTGKVGTNTSFELKGAIASDGLFLPKSLKAGAFNLSMSYDKDSDALSASAGGSVTIRDDRVGPGNIKFAVSIGFTYGGPNPSISVTGSYNGTKPWSPLGFESVTATELGFALDVGTTASKLTLTGLIQVGIGDGVPKVPVGFAIEASGDRNAEAGDPSEVIKVRLEMGSINLGQIMDALGSRFGTDLPDLGPDARKAGIKSAIADITIEDGQFNLYLEATAQILDGKSVSVAMAMNNTEALVALKLPDNLTLGDIVSSDLGGTFGGIPLPKGSILVRSPGAPLLVDDLASDDAKQFIAPLYGCTDPNDCAEKIEPGVKLVAEIKLPQHDDALEALWIQPGSAFRVTGTLPIFGGSDDFALTVDLPTIAPTTDAQKATAPWFKQANLSLGISQDGASLAFNATGSLIVLLDDETEANGQDEVTFTVGFEFEADLKGASFTIFGSASNWKTPMGQQWLDIDNITLEAKSSVGVNTSFQVGMRAKLRVDQTIIDASFAVSVAPAPTPIGVKIDLGMRLYVSSLTGRDLLKLAEMVSGQDLDPDLAPPIALKNLEISFAGPSIDSERLCLEPGFVIGGEIYLDDGTATVAVPDPKRDVNACATPTTGPSTGSATCANTPGCLAYSRFEINDEGLTARAGLGMLSFGNGAVKIHEARFDLVATADEQSFEIEGDIEVAGFVRAKGLVKLGTSEMRFRIQVADVAAGPNPEESFLIDAKAAWGSTTSFDLTISVTSEQFGNFTEGVTQFISDASTFFGGGPTDVVRVECFSFSIAASGGGAPLAGADGTGRTTNGILGEVHWSVRPGDFSSAPVGKMARIGWNFDADLATNLAGFADLRAENDTSGCGGIPDFIEFGNRTADLIAANATYGRVHTGCVNSIFVPCLPTFDLTTAKSYKTDYVNSTSRITKQVGSNDQTSHTFGLVFNAPGFSGYRVEYDQMSDPTLNDAGHTPLRTRTYATTGNDDIIIHQSSLQLTMRQPGLDRVRMRLYNHGTGKLIDEKFIPIYLYKTPVTDRQTTDVTVLEGDSVSIRQTVKLAPTLDHNDFSFDTAPVTAGFLDEVGVRFDQFDFTTRVLSGFTRWGADDQTEPGSPALVRGVIEQGATIVDDGVGDETAITVVNRPPYIRTVGINGDPALTSTTGYNFTSGTGWAPAYSLPFDDLSPMVATPTQVGSGATPSMQVGVEFGDPGQLDSPWTVTIRTSDGSSSTHTDNFAFNTTTFTHTFANGFPADEVDVQVTITDKDGAVSAEFERPLSFIGTNDDVADALALTDPEGDFTWTATSTTYQATHAPFEFDRFDVECAVWFSFELPPVIRPGDNARPRWFSVEAIGTTLDGWDEQDLNVYIPSNTASGSPNDPVTDLVAFGDNGPIISNADPANYFLSGSSSEGDTMYLAVYTPDGCGDDGTVTGPFELKVSVGPPTNDDLNTPAIHTVGTDVVDITNQTNFYAIDEVGETQLAGQPSNAAVWFEVRSPYSNARFDIETRHDSPSGQHLDTVMAVYTSPWFNSSADYDFNELLLYFEDDDSGSTGCGVCSSMSIDTRSDEGLPFVDTYPAGRNPSLWVQVGGYDGGSGPARGTFDLRITPHTTPALASDTGVVIPLALNPATKATAVLGANVGPASHRWSFLAPETGALNFEMTGPGSASAELRLVRDGGGSAVPIDGCGTDCYAVEAGTQYFVEFDGPDGDFAIDMSLETFAADSFDDAIVLTAQSTSAYATGTRSQGASNGRTSADGFAAIATRDIGEPFHAGVTSTDHTIWLALDVVAGRRVEITTADADFDTVLAVYRGDSVDELAEIASNDDRGDGDLTSRVVFVADRSERLHIALSGYGESFGSAQVSVVTASANLFDALTPTRLLDTRPGGETIDGVSQKEGQRGADSTYVLQVAGRGGVPSDAEAAVLNITSVRPTAGGFLTVYPCGTRPNASALNYVQGANTPNEIIAKLSPTGTVCIYTSAATELLADVVASTASGADYVSLTPARLADTRANATTIDGRFQRAGAVDAGTFYSVQVAGRGGVSSDATSAVLNIASVRSSERGFLTVWQCGTRPNASALNFDQGANTANEVITKLSDAGAVCIYSSATTELLVDVVGEMPSSGGFTSVTPARLADTRSGQTTVDGRYAGDGTVRGGESYTVEVAGRGNVADTATTAVLNITSVRPAAGGFFTVYPCGTQPNASALNFGPGQNRANEVIAKLSASGSICVFTSVDAEVLVDVVGYE